MIASLARFSPRPLPMAVPDGAKIAATVAVGGGALVTADLNLLTAAATTSLAIRFALASDRRLDGTTVRGHVDLTDVPILPIPVKGTVDIDALLGGLVDAPFAAGIVAADRVEVGPAAVTNASALFRVDREKAIWHELEATAYGGAIASAGVFRRAGRVVLTKIGARDVGV